MATQGSAARGLAQYQGRPKRRPLAWGLMLSAFTATSGTPISAAGINLALGRPYTVAPNPSYRWCTDEADAVQLSDGQMAGANWLNKSTVGWTRVSEPVVITFDLGQTEPISGASVHSVGGGHANVFSPTSIVLLASDDNRSFRFVASLDSQNVIQNRYDPLAARREPHTFHFANLRTAGRYVRFLIDVDGSYTFIDEIEIWRGSHEASSVVTREDNAFRSSDTAALFRLAREVAHVRSTFRRWEEDARLRGKPLNAEMTAVYRRWFKGDLHHRLEEWVRRGAELGRVRGRWLFARTNRRLKCEVANPMVPHRPDALPAPATGTTNKIILDVWQGEYESAAVSVYNCGDSPLTVQALLTPIRRPDGTMQPSDRAFRLRRAVAVDARGVGRTGDALVRLGSEGFELAAGMSGQIWVTFHDPTLTAGEYHFALDVHCIDDLSQAVVDRELVQGILRVHRVRFPERSSLVTCAWAYVERSDVTANVRADAVADLYAHYVRAMPLFWSTALPMPTVTADNRVKVDFWRHDAALELYRGADPYLFYWGLGRYRSNVPGFAAIGTALWKQQMRDWLTQWVEHLKRRGLDYEDFAMYPFDESIGGECFEFVKFIKTIDPRIQVYVNSRGKKGSGELARIAPYVDVWCFRDLPAFARTGRDERILRDGDTEVWSYDCARPAKGKPPYAYYRLQPWRAFARGDSGCGFWTYTDPGAGNGNAWDDFQAMDGKYGVVYGLPGKPDDLNLHGESIVPSRRWEAWREGVEDYEYLVRLREGIERVRAGGRPDVARRAATTLSRAVKFVLDAQDDPNVVYRARRMIVDEILALELR